jgi:hypothetical protein
MSRVDNHPGTSSTVIQSFLEQVDAFPWGRVVQEGLLPILVVKERRSHIDHSRVSIEAEIDHRMSLDGSG